jgi:hypothetical protein
MAAGSAGEWWQEREADLSPPGAKMVQLRIYFDPP